jgi:nitroreductase
MDRIKLSWFKNFFDIVFLFSVNYINQLSLNFLMEVFDCIKSRRSIRKFMDVEVGMEKLGLIIEAGKAAPSAGNLQNWKFILVTHKDAKDKLAEAAFQQYWIASAPAVIVVCAEIEKIEHYYGIRGEKLYAIQNCAAATQNMLLMAHNLGLGSCWVSAFDENMVARVVGTPANVRPQILLPVGFPDEEVPEPMEYTLDNVTYLERWINRIKDFPIFIHDYEIVGRLKEKLDNKIEKIKSKSSSEESESSSNVGEKAKKLLSKVKDKIKSKTTK